MNETIEIPIRILTVIAMAYALVMFAVPKAISITRTLRHDPGSIRTLWSSPKRFNPIRTVPRDMMFNYCQTANTMAVMMFISLIIIAFGYREDSVSLRAAGILTLTTTLLGGSLNLLASVALPTLRTIRHKPQKQTSARTNRTLPPLSPALWMYPAFIFLLETRYPSNWTGSAGINEALLWSASIATLVITTAWASTTLHLAWQAITRWTHQRKGQPGPSSPQ